MSDPIVPLTLCRIAITFALASGMCMGLLLGFLITSYVFMRDKR